MKTLFSFFLFIILCKIGAQTSPPTPPKYSPGQTQNMVQNLMHDTCLNKKFSVVVYIIQDSAFQIPSNPLALPTFSIPQMINLLNNEFKRICVSFEHCKTVIIPVYVYNQWMASSVGAQVINTWYTENTINVYLPNDVVSIRPDNPEHTYTYGPGTGTQVTRNAIVMEKGENVAASLFHVFGHFFGLPHTYAEIDPSNVPSPPPISGVSTYEYADRSNYTNCQLHGDGFCDTDADPYPYASANPTIVSNANCGDTGAKDGKGNYYTPPTDNYMSMYGQCRCRYTQEQMNFMAQYIRQKRMYLH